MPRVSGLISSLTNMLTRLTVRAETFEQAAIFLKKDKKNFHKTHIKKKDEYYQRTRQREVRSDVRHLHCSSLRTEPGNAALSHAQQYYFYCISIIFAYLNLLSI